MQQSLYTIIIKEDMFNKNSCITVFKFANMKVTKNVLKYTQTLTRNANCHLVESLVARFRFRNQRMRVKERITVLKKRKRKINSIDCGIYFNKVLRFTKYSSHKSSF